MFDLLTDTGEPAGKTKCRSEIHRDGDWHASVHIWIARRRLDGIEFLLQKRDDAKDSYPGCFDAASTGHIDAGEDPITAAIRELSEEIGVKARPSGLVLLCRRRVSENNIFHGKSFINNEITWVFLYKGSLPETAFCCEKGKVTAVCWQNAADLKYSLEHKDEHYCISLDEFNEVLRCAADILP